MRSVTSDWTDAQAESITAPSRLEGYLQTVKLVSGGNDVTSRWDFGNSDATKNIIEATILSSMDVTRAAIPLENCTIVIENGSLADEPNTDYDFAASAVRAALRNPGTMDIELGYKFDNGNVETLTMTHQRLVGAKVSDDDLYVTIEGESFLARANDSTFYGGRFSPHGIPASTLFAEILEDVSFPNEGIWNYTLGSANCKISATGTRPLWDPSAYSYYTIDPVLDDILVYIPIPPVTHREALTMLTAYVGAFVLYDADGTIQVKSGLGTRVDYAMDLDRIYGRPEVITGTEIGTLRGTIKSYAKADFADVILEASVKTTATGQSTFIISHDACEGTALTLVGATLANLPIFRTYSTVFEATPLGGEFFLRIEGYPVNINEARLDLVLDAANGEIREFNCPIASDARMIDQMYRNYAQMEGRTRYRVKMRDDARIEVGDRITLETKSEPTGIPVVVAEIRRTFNGATDAEYLVFTDDEIPWVQTNMVQSTMA